MSDEADFHCIDDAMHDAASQLFVQADELLTRWVMVAEVMTDQGERELRLLTNPNACAWDTTGLLAFATQLQQAVTNTLTDDS